MSEIQLDKMDIEAQDRDAIHVAVIQYMSEFLEKELAK